MDKPSFGISSGIFLLHLLLMAGVCQAENLPDPTRPPALLGPLPPAFGEEPANAPAPMPVLQSIILSPSRKAAIISGQTVVLGEKFGEARLVELTESKAVLRTVDGLQVLKLFPDVDKKERLVPQSEDMNGKRMRAVVPAKKVKQ